MAGVIDLDVGKLFVKIKLPSVLLCVRMLRLNWSFLLRMTVAVSAATSDI